MGLPRSVLAGGTRAQTDGPQIEPVALYLCGSTALPQFVADILNAY